jgi:asparagine synthase (glutamine-hydrolysing)
MFAFAIWDAGERRLMLARDRLGIKPLYWTDDGERFAFASEIKALLPLLDRREVDPVAFAQYLTFVAVPAPRTLFAGVSKLPPASILVVGRDGPGEPRRYWDALERRTADLRPADWAEELRVRLERSVQRRMMSDVPVGAFLSGGVDSSTNVALMSRLTDEPVRTFSVGFHGADELNEFDWARHVAERFGTEHHEIRIDEDDMWDFLPKLVYHQDEPIADPVCVPLHFVASLAKQHGVTVVHVGEGSDEIFSGYPTYLQARRVQDRYWARFMSLPAPVRAPVARIVGAVLADSPGLELHREAILRAARPEAELWWGGAVAFYERGLAAVTTDAFDREVRGERPSDVVADIAADARRFGARDSLDRMIYQDLRLRLPELLLMRVDKFTMANSIEGRVPFLDHELVELAMAIPAAEKIKRGEGKHVLKRAVEGLLPPEVVWRPKQGFGTPVEDWFRGALGDRLDGALRDSAINELGWLDRERVSQLLALHRSGRAERSFQLWNILNVSVWFDRWIAGREPVSEEFAGVKPRS